MNFSRGVRVTIAVVMLAIVLGGVLSIRGRHAAADLTGDANCDGTVNAIDSALILQHAAGFSLTFACPAKVDVNGDGDINSIDAALILQFSAGLLDDLGPPPATATRTRTRTPTSTRTPTLAPTSTPSGGSFSVQHVNTANEDTVLGPVLWVAGEVVNGNGQDVAGIRVTVNLYSASSVLLASRSGTTCVATLPPGGDSPFTILVNDPPAGIDRVDVSVTDYRTPPFFGYHPPVVGVDTDVTNVYTSASGNRYVVGTLANTSSNIYEMTRTCLAFYNTAGDVVRTDFNNTAPDTLGPGGTATFQSFVDADGTDIASQRVWVDASYADAPAPSGALSLHHASSYSDDTGVLWVVGEVRNDGNTNAGLIQITADAYSASNQLLASTTNSSCVLNLAPGGDSPYDIPIFEPPPGVDHVVPRVTQYTIPPFLHDPPITGVDINVTNVSTDGSGDRHVAGTFTNNSANTYEFAEACVAHYNAAGDVVRISDTSTQPSTLGPGATATFESIVDAEAKGIVSQRIWLAAQYQ